MKSYLLEVLQGFDRTLSIYLWLKLRQKVIENEAFVRKRERERERIRTA